jgi:predicted dehydrogenase
MSDSRLRVALVGVQHPHIEQVVQEVDGRGNEVVLIAVAEAEAELRESWSSRLDVPGYADYRELLERERPDAVAIAGINNERSSMIVAALQAGAHVTVDKPICTTLEQLACIETAWHESDRLFHCLLEKRFCPETLAAEQAFAAGELGDLVLVWASGPHRLRRQRRPDWMFSRESYGGIVNDLAIHDVDLLLHLIPAQQVWVQAWTRNRVAHTWPEFEDHGVLFLRTEELLATIEVHWFSPDAAAHEDYRMVLTGTEGTAELHFLAGEASLTTHAQPARRLALPPTKSAAGDFFDAVGGLTTPAVTAEQVFAASRISLVAQAHANSGEWVRCEVVAATEHDALRS